MERLREWERRLVCFLPPVASGAKDKADKESVAASSALLLAALAAILLAFATACAALFLLTTASARSYLGMSSRTVYARFVLLAICFFKSAARRSVPVRCFEARSDTLAPRLANVGSFSKALARLYANTCSALRARSAVGRMSAGLET